MTFSLHVRLTARLGGRDALSAWCLTLGVLAIVVAEFHHTVVTLTSLVIREGRIVFA